MISFNLSDILYLQKESFDGLDKVLNFAKSAIKPVNLSYLDNPDMLMDIKLIHKKPKVDTAEDS